MMDRDEMIEILTELARDEDVPASARVTAIRTLREFEPEPLPSGTWDDLDRAFPKIPKHQG